MDNLDVRDIFLYGDIDEESIKEVIQSIVDINYNDSLLLSELSNYTPNPIFLYISTYGGEVYECFGLCDIIKNSETPIYTIGLGKIMSAGLPIFTSGHNRYAYPNTTFMYHSVSSGSYGKLYDMKTDIQETERIQDIYDELIVENTKLKLSEVKTMLDSHKNVYFGVNEAKEMGFCDGIIGVDVTIS